MDPASAKLPETDTTSRATAPAGSEPTHGRAQTGQEGGCEPGRAPLQAAPESASTCKGVSADGSSSRPSAGLGCHGESSIQGILDELWQRQRRPMGRSRRAQALETRNTVRDRQQCGRGGVLCGCVCPATTYKASAAQGWILWPALHVPHWRRGRWLLQSLRIERTGSMLRRRHMSLEPAAVFLSESPDLGAAADNFQTNANFCGSTSRKADGRQSTERYSNQQQVAQGNEAGSPHSSQDSDVDQCSCDKAGVQFALSGTGNAKCAASGLSVDVTEFGDLSDALFSCLHGGKQFSGSFYEDCCNRDDHCNNLDWPLRPLRLIVLVEWLCEAELSR